MSGDPIRIDVSIEQAADVWLARYSSLNTRAAYGSDLRAFVSWCGDGSAALGATTNELTRYRAERIATGSNPATVDRQFAALRAFYGAACELGICSENPFGVRHAAVTAPSTTRSLTAEEATSIREASARDTRTSVLVHLLLDQGLRLAEVLALDHGDVSGSRNAKRLRVIRHGKPTNVIVDPAGSKAIHELEQYVPKPGPLFTGPSRGRRDPSRLTRFGADHLIKQAATTAGIGWSVSANVLRRTHVTLAQRTGVPVDQIGQSMGHRDLRSTRRYLTPIDTDNQPTS